MSKQSYSGETISRAPLQARCAALFFGAVVTATDLIPPHFRYGYVHALTRRMFQRPLPVLSSPLDSRPASTSPAVSSDAAALTCAMLTGSMDVGGIGSVVEVLATALPAVGIRPIVVCTEDGARAARLRSRGIEVIVVRAPMDEELLRELAPDVIELHGAPEFLESAAISSGVPMVPVLHNTEIHFNRSRWRRFARVLTKSSAAIAVSELVREFHARHVPEALAGRIRVVANAIPVQDAPTGEYRKVARRALAGVLQSDLDDEIVFVSLARYDAQKNITGLVSSFLSSVHNPRVRLVVAGEPSDWAEVRRADAIRRCSPSAERVSLLATSDARALLAAADGFILDSFFEGWPVAATEAAAMGVPLVLSDFGGASELVNRDPANSVLIANASGSAGAVSDAAVARARRRCRRQPNAAELGAAIDAVAASIVAGARPLPGPTGELMDVMIEGHADVLRRAAAAVRDDETVVRNRVERDRA